jgi:phage terminase Nu1 subunit (DNA packaging protein)
VKVSYRQLADLTGYTSRTIRAKLTASTLEPDDPGPGKTMLWESADALRVILCESNKQYSGANGCKIDYNVEKARTEKERADKLEMENAQRRGELVEVADVVAQWSKVVINAKNKLLSIPSRASVLIDDDEERRRVFSEVKEIVDGVLTELGGKLDES